MLLFVRSGRALGELNVRQRSISPGLYASDQETVVFNKTDQTVESTWSMQWRKQRAREKK